MDRLDNDIPQEARIITSCEPRQDADEVITQIIEALRGRAAFYDLLAAVYFRPLTAEQIERFANLDVSAYADMNELFADGWNDIARSLRKRHSGTRQQLAVDFTGSFGGTSSWKGRYAVPYESVHTSEEGLMFQESYHDVLALYRQNRVARSEGYDYPDDHLSFMCEFEAILSGRIIEALEAARYEEAMRQTGIALDFLNDHIRSWFPTLRDLALNLLETRFYRGILKLSEGFFDEDAELLASIEAELAAKTTSLEEGE